MLTRVVQHYGRWKEAAWASGGLILESDEKRLFLPNHPSTRRRNMKKAIAGVLVVLGIFLAPGAAVAGLHESAWPGCFPLLNTIFRDVRSCLLCDDARDCWCGWRRSCFMARLSKIRKKKTKQPTTPRSVILQTFSMAILAKKGEI